MCGHCEGHGWHGYGWEGRGHHHPGGREGCDCGREHRGHGGCCGGPREGGPHHGSGCCCEDRPWGFRRRFVSRAERIQELEAYLAELRAEVTAVEEHLADLKKAA
ncbi:MAG: hypothetical protein ACP5UQ_12215 [Anaerolineae bacterium]